MEYTITSSELQVTIHSMGAALTSIKSKDGTEYLWQGDPAYWVGQAPNLFPFIGGFTDGKYEFSGEFYQMAKHGFMRTIAFELEEQSENKVVLSLQANEVTKAQFPFEFVISVIYKLEGSKIEVSYVVKNMDNKTMYFAIGGHPGFNVPLEESVAFEEYYLEFTQDSQPQAIGLTDDGYITGDDIPYELVEGNKIPMEHKLFDHDAIVLKEMCKEVTLKCDKSGRQVTVTYPDMDYLGIWHMPKTDAPYVCIEPWTSLPSRKDIIEDFETKEDLIKLPVKETYINTWQIVIQ